MTRPTLEYRRRRLPAPTDGWDDETPIGFWGLSFTAASAGLGLLAHADTSLLPDGLGRVFLPVAAMLWLQGSIACWAALWRPYRQRWAGAAGLLVAAAVASWVALTVRRWAA